MQDRMFRCDPAAGPVGGLTAKQHSTSASVACTRGEAPAQPADTRSAQPRQHGSATASCHQHVDAATLHLGSGTPRPLGVVGAQPEPVEPPLRHETDRPPMADQLKRAQHMVGRWVVRHPEGESHVAAVHQHVGQRPPNADDRRGEAAVSVPPERPDDLPDRPACLHSRRGVGWRATCTGRTHELEQERPLRRRDRAGQVGGHGADVPPRAQARGAQLAFVQALEQVSDRAAFGSRRGEDSPRCP